MFVFVSFVHISNAGNWLSVNGEAIYGTRPWMVCQNETISSVFYTTKQQLKNGVNETVLYAIFTKWPQNNMLRLSCVVPTSATKIYFLGLDDDDDTLTKNAHLSYRPMADRDDPSTLGSAKLTPRRERHDHDSRGIEVVVPALTPNVIPCQHAWVLVLSNVENM